MSYLRVALAFCALTSLSACSAGSDELRGDPIECAIGPAGKMESNCRLERIGEQLVAHHPDGGFRRLALAPDGRSVSPADGAEKAMSEVTPDALELTIGQDRYRIPFALLKPDNDR